MIAALGCRDQACAPLHALQRHQKIVRRLPGRVDPEAGFDLGTQILNAARPEKIPQGLLGIDRHAEMQIGRRLPARIQHLQTADFGFHTRRLVLAGVVAQRAFIHLNLLRGRRRAGNRQRCRFGNGHARWHAEPLGTGRGGESNARRNQRAK